MSSSPESDHKKGRPSKKQRDRFHSRERPHPVIDLLMPASVIAEAPRVRTASQADEEAREMEYLFVDYGVAGEPWHERFLLKRLAGGSDYIILTPVNDMYRKTLAAPPLDAIRACGPSRSLPLGRGARAGQPVHRLADAPSPAKLKRVLDEAVSLASIARLSDLGRRFPVAAMSNAAVLHASPSPGFLPVGKRWICCAVYGGTALGAVVEDSLVTLHGVISGDLALVSHLMEPPFLVKMINEADIDKEIEAWKALQLLSEVLERTITYSQLDLSNLACAETLCRRMPLIKFETRKKRDARKGGGSSGSVYSPELQMHIADKASRDTAILREQRKAADERALTREHTKGDQ
jgi:hypothetical protein